MVKQKGKRQPIRGKHGSKDRDSVEIDALFQVPLTEFTAARNALATRLNKEGNAAAADKVKSIGKPSISAWVVNQLYWQHREEYSHLIEAGRGLIQANIRQLSGSAADIGAAQREQRAAISDLLHLAEMHLRGSGHNPTPEMMRRISSTLEAIAAYGSSPDGPQPGLLTADVDPPGFESIANLIPLPGAAKPAGARIIPFKPSVQSRAATKQSVDEFIDLAKAELEKAEKGFAEAQKVHSSREDVKSQAASDLAEAEKRRIQAEEMLEKLKLAEQEAQERLEIAVQDTRKSARMMEDAERALQKARTRLKKQD